MATINSLAQKDISNAFAGFDVGFLSPSDLAKLQETTTKDLLRYMDPKPALQQKPTETSPSKLITSSTVQKPVPAYTRLANAADQRKKDEPTKQSIKPNSTATEPSGFFGTFATLFGRKDKPADNWDNGPITV